MIVVASGGRRLDLVPGKRQLLMEVLQPNLSSNCCEGQYDVENVSRADREILYTVTMLMLLLFEVWQVRGVQGEEERQSCSANDDAFGGGVGNGRADSSNHHYSHSD